MDLIALAGQRFDHASSRLGAALDRNASVHERDLTRISARLNASLLDRPRVQGARRLVETTARLRPAADRLFSRAAERLEGLEKLRLTLDPNRPLTRGFARVHHADGHIARVAADLTSGEAVQLVFVDGARAAVVDGPSPAVDVSARRPKAVQPATGQGDLF